MGCGVYEHDAECLCDVPTLGVQISADAVNGMWLGDRIASILGIDERGWDRDTVLQWLETLVMVHDRHRDMSDFQAPTLAEVMPVGYRGNPLEFWAAIRRAVQDCVTRFQVDSVLDVLPRLGVSFSEFLSAVSSGKYAGDMDEDGWRAFEADMLDYRPNYAAVCRKHGVSRQSMVTFRALLDPIHVRKHGQKPNHEDVVAFIRERVLAGEPDRIIAEAATAHFGYPCSKEKVRWHRRLVVR
jgi:hypothetical protein